jgi:hypothetical protein
VLSSRTLGHFASSVGPAALLAEGLLVYLVLAWLAHSASGPFDRTLLLAIANLGLACVLFVPQFRNGQLLLSRTTTVALLGWSAAYSITYGAFVRWPELISVWGLLAAQACAPLIAVFVSGDHRRDTASFKRRLVISSPIVFLIGVAFLEWKSSSHVVIAPLVALALVVLFALSQSCARVVARNAPSAFWGPPRLAFSNGILLLIFWAVVGRGGVRGNGLDLLRGAAFLSVGILAVQALYLLGLAKTAPFLSALFLSVTVPISIFGDSLTKNGTPHSPLSLWLSVVFSLATGLVGWTTSSERTRVVELTTRMTMEAE